MQLEQERGSEHRNERWFFHASDYPGREVSLRSISASSYGLLDEPQNYRLMEELEATTAFFRVYPGGDLPAPGRILPDYPSGSGERIAYARPVEVDYYTQPREVNDVRIIRSDPASA